MREERQYSSMGFELRAPLARPHRARDKPCAKPKRWQPRTSALGLKRGLSDFGLPLVLTVSRMCLPGKLTQLVCLLGTGLSAHLKLLGLEVLLYHSS
jgi:hypothetical protein